MTGLQRGVINHFHHDCLQAHTHTHVQTWQQERIHLVPIQKDRDVEGSNATRKSAFATHRCCNYCSTCELHENFIVNCSRPIGISLLFCHTHDGCR